MKSSIIALLLTTLFFGAAIAAERPTDAQLNAYKAVHHAKYLKVPILTICLRVIAIKLLA